MEDWRGIPSFPGYSVSHTGRVRNDDTGRMMSVGRNQFGIAMVGLTRNGIQHRRSVAVLVASTFLPTMNPSFDTPINLDGDRGNNHVLNLDWRPRWFAVKYFQQFHEEPQGYDVPIEEITTGETFPNTWIAAIRYGLLEMEIVFGMMKNTPVFPTYQLFRVII
jgi:hypothetical protein